MKTIRVEHKFLPVINDDTQVLILGSIPSLVSRQHGFYYMHPQNRFWPLLSKLLNIDLVNMDIEEKKRVLHKFKIGLYDVIDSCDIIGSQDSKIKNEVINSIEIYITNNNLKKIFLNGKKAGQLFNQHFPAFKEMAVILPSTSPANATYKMSDLVDCWKVILDYIKL